MDERWKTNPGCVYNVSYQIIWCTKYRRKLLLGEVEERLRSLLIEKATANGWDIPELEIMPDHVHLFVKATPSDSIAHITSQLKGYTSFSLRNEFPTSSRESLHCGHAHTMWRPSGIYLRRLSSNTSKTRKRSRFRENFHPIPERMGFQLTLIVRLIDEALKRIGAELVCTPLDEEVQPYFTRYPLFGLPTDVVDCVILYK